MALPRHILDRVERVFAYHRASKLTYAQPSPAPNTAPPSPYLEFPDNPRLPLPTTLLDVPLGALAVLESSLAALPDSFVAPPQTLKTLATWLYMADGVIGRRQDGPFTFPLRTCPSQGDLYPFEIYVAAFSLQDLEPGLYHYNPRSFSLSKLRDGSDTLTLIKRGRPDLEFIKRAPAALLISTVYCRSAWRYGSRGYRAALLDAGQSVQNLVSTAVGLGIQTITRLRMTESNMRELIGISPDAAFGEEESVQSMVVWADRSQREAILTHVTAARPVTLPMEFDGDAPLSGSSLTGVTEAAAATPPARLAINAGGAAVASLDMPDLMLPSYNRPMLIPIARAPLADRIMPHGSIVAAHHDCVAPGFAVRDIRPPLTELSPLPPQYPDVPMATPAKPGPGQSLRPILLDDGGAVRTFIRGPIPRDAFRTISRLAFGGGSYYPMFPAGPHAAFPRAFWIVHNIAGMDPGVWYYRTATNLWCLLREGSYRLETHYLTSEHDAFLDAAAVCVMVANMHGLMTYGGPDTYRLAHLEAGAIARRLCLGARGYGFASADTIFFFDDELREFLGLEKTGWEPLIAVALGVPSGGSPEGTHAPSLL